MTDTDSPDGAVVPTFPEENSATAISLSENHGHSHSHRERVRAIPQSPAPDTQRRRKGVAARILDTLFPPRCAGCGIRGVELCERCLAGIRSMDPASCPRCGRASRLGALCQGCRRYEGPLNGIRTACVYEGVARKAIHGLKYRHRQALAVPLTGLLEAELRRRPLQIDLLVPVPLHPKRLAARGYNQSELLASELGRRLGVDVVQCLVRNRETDSQAGLSAAVRQSNVRNAFGFIGDVSVAGLRLGVVDDVCTTGATLEDCARALGIAGAAAVWGIAVARDL